MTLFFCRFAPKPLDGMDAAESGEAPEAAGSARVRPRPWLVSNVAGHVLLSPIRTNNRSQWGCLEKNAMDLRKVYGGTAIGQNSRCDSCVFARVIRGYSESECITLCDRLYEAIRIPFKVRECSDYIDKRLPRIEHLEDIAWIIRSKSAGNRAGFNPIAVANADDQASEDPVEVPEESPAETPEEVPAVAVKK
jgi:hypothetical protein